MKQTKFKQDKGVAGLTILLSLIVMLFIIGLIVMIFSLMGGEMNDALYTSTTSTIANESVATFNYSVGDQLSKYGLNHVTCSVSAVINTTNQLVPSTNYTVTGCLLKATSNSDWLNANINVSYSYTYDANNTATNVMSDTVTGVGGVVDWFDIFIVIGAMVVLILLTVIIITAIRSSGMIGAGTPSGANQVGTA